MKGLSQRQPFSYVLLLYQSDKEDNDAGTNYTADDASEDTIDGQAKQIENKSADNTTNQAKDNINEKAVTALHDISGEASANTTDNK